MFSSLVPSLVKPLNGYQCVRVTVSVLRVGPTDGESGTRVDTGIVRSKDDDTGLGRVGSFVHGTVVGETEDNEVGVNTV